MDSDSDKDSDNRVDLDCPNNEAIERSSSDFLDYGDQTRRGFIEFDREFKPLLVYDTK